MVNITASALAEGATYHLRTIYLRRSESSMADGFDPTLGTKALDPLFRTSNLGWVCSELSAEDAKNLADQARLLTCTITFRFEFVYLDPDKRASASSDENELPKEAIVARIVADISTDYVVSRESHPSDEEIGKWAENNTILHAWPYWREYCHSALMRMGLPVTIMPLVQRAESPRPNTKGSPEASAPNKKRARRKLDN